ncbi:MAG: rRNA maturation RNase YbeY [Chloroflexota bacterium]|nr:rRNA maturation RNase YbeY [Chloroflexota bacterium]
MTAAPTGEAPLDLAVDLVVETATPPALDAQAVERLVGSLLTAEGATGDWQVTVALVDDDRLRALHREFMGLDSPTDVMTFPLDASGEGVVRGGDVVVSVERAADQATEYDLSTTDEVRFLIAHGVLHLAGWDDRSDGDRARMLERQKELLAALDRGEERPPAP